MFAVIACVCQDYVLYIVVYRLLWSDQVLYTFCSFCFFLFKQKTAYEMRISDWSSDVCSTDLLADTLAAQWKKWDQVDRVQLDSAWVRRLEAIQIGRASCRERVCQYV